MSYLVGPKGVPDLPISPRLVDLASRRCT